MPAQVRIPWLPVQNAGGRPAFWGTPHFGVVTWGWILLPEVTYNAFTLLSLAQGSNWCKCGGTPQISIYIGMLKVLYTKLPSSKTLPQKMARENIWKAMYKYIDVHSFTIISSFWQKAMRMLSGSKIVSLTLCLVAIFLIFIVIFYLISTLMLKVSNCNGFHRWTMHCIIWVFLFVHFIPVT